MVTISLSDEDAAVLREALDAKLIELKREESHTDSPRFRETLYQLDGVLRRVLEQLSQPS